MPISLSDIDSLLLTRGVARRGASPVSQLEHALQCADLAESEGAPPSLVSACLLHDFGHLLSDLGEESDFHVVNDWHEYVAMPFLRPHFPEAVLAPIRLHVEAKRYLCAMDPDHWLAMPEFARRSLELQGGPFNEEEAARFIAQPHAKDAVLLRQWDDRARRPGYRTPDYSHFSGILASCTRIAVRMGEIDSGRVHGPTGRDTEKATFRIR